MGVNSLPKTITRQRRDCDLKPGPSAPESSTLTTRLPSYAYIILPYAYTDRTVAMTPVYVDRLWLTRIRTGGLSIESLKLDPENTRACGSYVRLRAAC